MPPNKSKTSSPNSLKDKSAPSTSSPAKNKIPSEMPSESAVSCQAVRLLVATMSSSASTITSSADTKTLNFSDFSTVPKVSSPENTWKSLNKKSTISKTEGVSI